MTSRRSEAILRIPCTVCSPRVRRAIRRVLLAVRRHPKDWARLRRRVLAFAYLVGEDRSTLGEWVRDPESMRKCAATDDPRDPESMRKCAATDDPRSWGRQGREEYLAAGRIMLSRRVGQLRLTDLVAVVAHECGHAVTRAREVEIRETGFDSEWAGELCADRLAFRWGFEREIRANARRRHLAHHGALPGETLSENGIAYRCDRNFFLRAAAGGR